MFLHNLSNFSFGGFWGPTYSCFENSMLVKERLISYSTDDGSQSEAHKYKLCDGATASLHKISLAAVRFYAEIKRCFSIKICSDFQRFLLSTGVPMRTVNLRDDNKEILGELRAGSSTASALICIRYPKDHQPRLNYF